MVRTKKQSILEKYDSYEAVPAAVKAWITMRAEETGKSVKMSHAGYKAAFKRIQNETTITILKEDMGYLGGCCNSSPIYHIIKARNIDMLVSKIQVICDAISETQQDDKFQKDEDIESRECLEDIEGSVDDIRGLVQDGDGFEIGGTKLEIISVPDCVFVC